MFVVGNLPLVYLFRAVVEYDSGYRYPEYGTDQNNNTVGPVASTLPVESTTGVSLRWQDVGGSTVDLTQAFYTLDSTTETAATARLLEAQFSTLSKVETLDETNFPPPPFP